MSLLPYLNTDNSLVDGSLFHLLPFCKKNCSSQMCQMHYKKLSVAAPGEYCCPYGLSSLIFEGPEGHIIYSGLRIKEVYNKKKAKVAVSSEYVYNPLVDKEVFCSIAKEQSVSMSERQALEKEIDAVKDLLHDMRSLNAQIKAKTDSIWDLSDDEDCINTTDLIETLKSVQVSSMMMTNSFAYFDSVLNPEISIGSPYPAVVFKKFDKMRKLLKNYMGKNVWISLETPCQSNYQYRVYSTFESLLFIILENAIKYSPNSKAVKVRFNENDSILDVTIESEGPYCDENELVQLCNKGFRGQNAKIAQQKGQGFGLSFAKKICESHRIDISFQSTYSKKDHGIKYGIFLVKLHFDNKNYPIS